MAAAIPIIQIGLSVYSAVTAVKALSDGNIMGAIMGGFGAYMGFSNLNAFSAATTGDALAISAESAAGGVEGISAGALGDTFAGVGELSSFTTPALEQSANIFGSAGVGALEGLSTLPSGATNIGSNITLGSNIGSGETSWWQNVIDTGEGYLNDVGNLISNQDGSLLAKAADMGISGSDVLNLGKMGASYYMDKRKQDAQMEAIEDAEARRRADAAATRGRIGAAPTYVHDFTGKRRIG